MTAPIEHLQDALSLSADALIDLYEVRLKTTNTVFNFWNGLTRTWQGTEYEGWASQVTGESRSTTGQASRPQLSVINPGNALGVFASEGLLDLAEVTRKRLLQNHFINDVNIFEQRVWLIGRVTEVTNNVLRVELRSPTDMPIWQTPRRQYLPPEFPVVTI